MTSSYPKIMDIKCTNIDKNFAPKGKNMNNGLKFIKVPTKYMTNFLKELCKLPGVMSIYLYLI